MDKILNKTKTEWIIINDQDEIWVGQKNPGFMPLSEFKEAKISLKSYRGWKSAINGVLQAGGCSEKDIKQNRIRVLPVTTILQIDDSYKEIPVSSYFKDFEIKRYILTKEFGLIFDLWDSSLRLKLDKDRYGNEIKHFVRWTEEDRYGKSHSYSDEVIASSDDRKELEELKFQPLQKLAKKLAKEDYLEDIEQFISEEEGLKILEYLTEIKHKYYTLTLHRNVNYWGTSYDLSIDEAEKNSFETEEWLNYTR